MELYSLFISKDNSWEIMNELGRMSALHFLDLNQNESIANRTYSSTIKRCDETERRIRFIEEEAKRLEASYRVPPSVDQFFEAMDAIKKSNVVLGSNLIDDYENELKDRENFLREQTKKLKEIQERKKYLLEHQQVLKTTKEMMKKGYMPEEKEGKAQALLDQMAMKFTSISGVISRMDCERFKRLTFRVSRGFVIKHYIRKCLCDVP